MALGFSQAQAYLAPRIQEQVGSRINFPTLPLDRETGYPWDDEILTLPVSGSYMTEVMFFHHASRTLLLTDLIENFEPGKLGSLLMRFLTNIGGAGSGRWHAV